MRKMMMAALLTVISLSACAVQDANPTDDEATVETAGTGADDAQPEDESPTPTPPSIPAQPDVITHSSDLQPVLEAMPCESNDDCPSNVCDLEKERCRAYPF